MEPNEPFNQLSEFALLLKEAKAEKLRLAKERQDEEDRRKETEVVPLLSELFSLISKEKTKAIEVIQEIPKEVIPVPIVESFPPEPLVKKIVPPIVPFVSDSEKNMMLMFKKLQDEFAFLKKFVGSQHSGGGEVRLLKLDDVVNQVPNNDDVMVWDSTLNKFNFTDQASMLSVTHNVISKETIIPIDTSYSVISYLKLKAPLIIHGNVKIT